MLAVGMEGPNVNLLFKNKLEEEFSFIEVGTFVRLLKLPIFNKRKGKLDNVHTCLHDVGKCQNFCLGNSLTFDCIFFMQVYQIYMVILHYWFLKVQG